MKSTAVRPTRYAYYRRNTCTAYPNAAAQRNIAERVLDAALAAAITVGIVVIVLFLLALA